MYTYPSRKEKKSGKRELVTVTMRKETDKQGVEGVVESESTWFCDTHTQDSFDITSVFIGSGRYFIYDSYSVPIYIFLYCTL